ncbi:MAG: LuxR C-terminal-related transcriptional regulator [Candidatus Xenobia bacterium]
MPIRVAIIDDHPIVRQGLVALLEDDDSFVVVVAGEASEEVQRRAAQADVVLMDLEMPGIDTAAVMHRMGEARILVFTAYADDDRLRVALDAGAQGYLLKGASSEEIGRAIRTVHEGGSYLEPRVAARVLALRGHAPTRLSDRERTVLRLVAAGRSNKQIAAELGITERTAKFHVESARNKLGAENRAQAVALATSRGLL